MRRRRSRQEEEGPGQDSFLDIVANLVGILIILVMVIGVRAKDALEAAAADTQTSLVTQPDNVPIEELKAAQELVENVTSGVKTIQTKIDTVNHELIARYNQRGRLQVVVTALKRELEECYVTQSEAERAHREEIELIEKARHDLDNIINRQRVLETQISNPIALEHIPTPLAKTVFGDEIHFRLLDGRLTYVPLNEIVKRLEKQWKNRLWKLKETDQFSDTLGEIGGFILRYTVARRALETETPVGPAQRDVVFISKFELIPSEEPLGVPLEDALAPNSEFRSLISKYDSRRTTVTIWTYPDSFDQFRLLKNELYRLGYLTAGRPLPEGANISGSPNGSRSSAQ